MDMLEPVFDRSTFSKNREPVNGDGQEGLRNASAEKARTPPSPARRANGHPISGG